MSYDKVSLLLPMNGANNGTVFTDWSPVPKAITVFGNAKTVTAESKYYGSSADFDGTGDYLSIPDSDDWHFADGDFTIEGHIRPGTPGSGAARVIVHQGTGSVVSTTSFTFYLGVASSAYNQLIIRLCFGSSQTYPLVDYAFTPNTWYHVAVSRASGVLRFFVDGVQIGSDNVSTQNLNNVNQPLLIGRWTDQSFDYIGQMQDIRIIKGAGIYTANFTPPARLIGTISNSAVGADKILDAAGNPAERTVIAVPRSAPVRIFSDVSNASGEFEIQAPAGVDHSVVAIADEATLYNDIVHRVIPE